MKWLDSFSIRQKLTILLCFLLSALSYIVFTAIDQVKQRSLSDINIEIVQQQRVIAHKFINACFFTREETAVEGQKVFSSEIKQHQFLFEKNLKALLHGGKAYLDLEMDNSVYLADNASEAVRVLIQKSLEIWKRLQRETQHFTPQTIPKEQLVIIHHLYRQLDDNMTKLLNSLIQNRSDSAQQNLFTLQLSWLFTFIISALFTRLIARNISLPLGNIAQIATRIRCGDLQSYSHLNTHHDELGTIFYQADELRLVLSDLMQTIQQHNKQVLHSSSQINNRATEVNHLYFLQYKQVENILMQIKSFKLHLDNHNEGLLKQSHSHTQTEELIEAFWQVILLSSNSAQQIQTKNNLNADNINKLQEDTQSLYEELANINEIAIKAENLAKKATIDAVHAGKQSEQFTLVANQITHLAAKSANSSEAVTRLLAQFQKQIKELSTPATLIQEQLNYSQTLFTQKEQLMSDLQHHIQKQQGDTYQLNQERKSLQTDIEVIERALQELLPLIKNSAEKVDESNLFTQDLQVIYAQLATLSGQFQLDELLKRPRKSNDKRDFPRIDNQLKVTLHQQGKTVAGLTQDICLEGLKFKSVQPVNLDLKMPVSLTLNLPMQVAEDDQVLTLLADIVHYEQLDKYFYYGIHFHTLSAQDKSSLQLTFKYFNKKAEFKQPPLHS